MLQFYLLSIVLNAAAGYVLFMGGEETGMPDENGFRLSFDNERFRLVLGIASLLVGLFKILSVSPGNIPVIGDILPAVTGILSGFVLVFSHFRRRSESALENTEKLEGFIGKNRKWIGLTSLVTAGLHFLFPSVLLL